METNQTCIYLFIHYFFRQSSRTNLRAVIKGHPQFVPRQLLPRAAFLLSLPLPLPLPLCHCHARCDVSLAASVMHPFAGCTK